jgi:Co/Zn/Cd efflux system component
MNFIQKYYFSLTRQRAQSSPLYLLADHQLFLFNKPNLRKLHTWWNPLVSLRVVVAGVFIAFTGIVWIDSLVTFVIITVIFYISCPLLIDSVNLALDAVPPNINL